ncbi:ABC transporter permease [Micromonospora globispora]|nr:ABC transporter permease [Micromonospora globispora]RQW98014.1 ABC transporter permease [Micromonospora globispora]
MQPGMPAETHGRRWPMRSRPAARRFPVAQLAVVLGVFVWGSVQIDGFSSGPSVRAMLVIASLLALASLGQTLVILVGGLDLAVPGYITVGAVATAELAGTKGWPLWAVAVSVVGVCAFAGGVCGAICHYLRVQSLVVTLGMSSVLIGGVIVATKASNLGVPPQDISKWTFVMGETLDVPVPPVVCLAVGVVVGSWLFLAHTPAGRRLYATGANPRAAEGILIRTGRVWITTFAFGAAATGLAGMLIASYSSGASVTIGDPYFYSGLAAVLVGGTALGSARGDFLRTVLGALILTALTTILSGMGLGEGDSRILFGLAIIVVVLAYGRDRRLRDRI